MTNNKTVETFSLPSTPNFIALSALENDPTLIEDQNSATADADLPPPPKIKDQFFKTKLCIPFVSGYCRRGKVCW